MKRWRNWIIFLAVVGLLAYSIGLWRARLISLKQAVSDQNNQTDTVPAGVGGDSSSPVDQILNNQNDQSSSQSTSSDDTVLKRVTYSANTLYEAQAVNMVNDFEQALNQKNQTVVAALFDKSAAPDQIPPGTWVDDAPFPISFTIAALEVRGDTSALVTVDETWLDKAANTKSTHHRLFELYPTDNSYKIGKYFTDNNTDPLSGFIDNPWDDRNLGVSRVF